VPDILEYAKPTTMPRAAVWALRLARVFAWWSFLLAIWIGWNVLEVAYADKFEHRPFVFFGTWSRHRWAIAINPLWPAFAVLGASLSFVKRPRWWSRSDIGSFTVSLIALGAFVVMSAIWC
jgi:hypothetical protein